MSLDDDHPFTDGGGGGALNGESLVCPLCERTVLVSYTTKHHLVPKSRKGRVTERLCRDCHKQLHVLFTPKELERRYPTVALLKSDPKVQTWITWIAKRTSSSRLRGSMRYR